MSETTMQADELLAAMMPRPAGYKLLISLPKPEEKTSGGIIKSKETLHHEQISSVYGRVIDMGPDAYKDKKRCPSGPYCKIGDWIMMRSYAGTRFTIQGEEFRILNDDSVEGTVEDPTGIAKI